VDLELYPLKLVRDSKGKPLIEESRKDHEHGQLFGPSSLWLSIKLTELSLQSSVMRKKGNEKRVSQDILGSGLFETIATNNNSSIGSVHLFGSDREALKGSVSISPVDYECEGIDFFIDEPSSESSLSNSEGSWQARVGVSVEEFNNILDAMQYNRLNGITINFNAKNSPLIFDDTNNFNPTYSSIKLLSDPIRLALDSEWPLHPELPLLELPLELYWPSEFQVDDNLIVDFRMLVYTNKTTF